jgi:hypothetical protein
MKTCHKCGIPLEMESVFRRDECPSCSADLHVCLNCIFYDPGRSNQCFEPQAERVTEKERSNYCDYFQFKEGGAQSTDKTETEKLWQSLFKKKEE